MHSQRRRKQTKELREKQEEKLASSKPVERNMMNLIKYGKLRHESCPFDLAILVLSYVRHRECEKENGKGGNVHRQY